MHDGDMSLKIVYVSMKSYASKFSTSIQHFLCCYTHSQFVYPVKEAKIVSVTRCYALPYHASSFTTLKIQIGRNNPLTMVVLPRNSNNRFLGNSNCG